MPPHRLELWGGVECTVARIDDRYRDQIAETGHRERLSDLDAIAALGIRTLRYPVLWETVGGEAGSSGWSWHDERLAKLRALGIRPIAGLIHHGSGPRDTNLLDPDFPKRLAEHAGRVARRYPWIEDFTPVNEPLTTARFSALYGLWYPHRTSYADFLTALVQQCRATVLSMRAIRRVTPSARLIQTDDLGKTFSTPELAYQAEYENERRWLTFDLLCGRVDRSHPFWAELREHGITAEALSFFLQGDGAPDIIGVNHYLTSERFLDPHWERYPPHLRGGNAFGSYADAEAVRMRLPDADLGPAARLREAWERYRLPIAVTEVHHGCTRDEQLRWLADVWRAAETVRQEGADIRAVTIWSLFGAVDWASLLTRAQGIYEPGAFDIRGPAPRPTALARAAREITATGRFEHPVLDRPGWWRRPERYYAPAPTGAGRARPAPVRRLMLAGASTPLGRAFSRVCAVRGLDHVATSRQELDQARERGLHAALDRHGPWAVVDAAGWDGPAWDERSAHASEDDGTVLLAHACARRNIPFVTFGSRSSEEDARIAAAHPDALIVRHGVLFGPWDRENVLWSAMRRLASGAPVEASSEPVSLSYVPDLLHVALDLLIDGERGVWPLANPGPVPYHDLLRDAAERAGLDPERVMQVAARTDGPHGPLRPVLERERGRLLPPLSSALDRFFHEAEASWVDAAVPDAAAA